MSKPATIVLGALGLTALAAILAMFALRDKRPSPAPPEAQEPVAAAIPVSSRLAAAATKPLPPLPPPLLAGPKPRNAAGPDAGKRLDETSLMAKLHDLAASDPPL